MVNYEYSFRNNPTRIAKRKEMGGYVKHKALGFYLRAWPPPITAGSSNSYFTYLSGCVT